MSGKKKSSKKLTKRERKLKKENNILIISTISIVLVLILILVIKSLLGKTLNDVTIKENNSLSYSSRILERVDTSNDNVMISDISLNPILSIFYQYGNKKVQEELQNYFENTPAEIIENYNQLYRRYKNNYKKINFENVYWINKKDAPISKDVIKTAKRDLHFSIKEKDFTKNQTASEMNKWIEKKSHNKVKGEYKTSDISSMNSILMGTIYFHEKWGKTYEEKDIQEGIFYGIDGEQKVTYLKSEESLYLENDKAIGFMKAYEDKDLYFIGIIPTEGNTLNNINIEELMKNKKKMDVTVKIPEFQFEYEIHLVDTLKNLGIRSIFEPGNLDKISKGTYVSDVIQKNFVEVNRNGTEAFSLTETMIKTTSLELASKEVYLDKPFLFLIYDEKVDQVLFMGRVNNVE